MAERVKLPVNNSNRVNVVVEAEVTIIAQASHEAGDKDDDASSFPLFSVLSRGSVILKLVY